jgi:putative oxidoreductase
MSSLRRNILRYLDRLQPLALLVMRLAVGAIMVVHGYHNVFGGLQHHAQWIASLGVPRWLGYVSSLTELVGGLLLLAGFFTRIGHLRRFDSGAVEGSSAQRAHGIS